MNSTILFRFDASAQIGLGHAYRCLALIEALTAQKKYNVLVVSEILPSFLIDKLSAYHAKVQLLGSGLNSTQEIASIEALKKNLTCGNVVLDGYQFNGDYRKQLRALDLNIICFDDINTLTHLYCDVVINALPNAFQLGYQQSAESAKYLLGLPYSVIRNEFIQSKKINYKERQSVLINFGGSDVLNLTIPTIKLLESSILAKEHKIIVVTGGAFKEHQLVNELCVQLGFEHQHNCNNMSNVIQKCKLAICAPGAIIYELAYCGVPSIFITVADNQLLSAQSHQALGWCYVIHHKVNGVLQQAVGMAEQLSHDKNKLIEMSKKSISLVDGNGVNRIIEEMIL